ncbi:MAG: hypothetical protein IIA53_05930 [Chloroflexi bacterium]|nr:hypothetical protein [Chloroflexota bacterium]
MAELPGGFVTAYIGLGSNLGDRSKNLSGAVERLSRIGTIDAVSARDFALEFLGARHSCSSAV